MAKAKAGKKPKAAGKSKARPAARAVKKDAASKSRSVKKTVKKAAPRKAKKKVSYIPKGMGAVNVSLCVKDAAKALEFYKTALGATVRNVMPGPGGQGVVHAEFRVAGTTIMIGDEFPGFPNRSPESLGAATASLYCYVPNCDAAFDRAVKAGATAIGPLVTMFWGDRMGAVKDPFGHMWTLATHVEEVAPAEMRKRHKAFTAQMARGGGMGN
jgi:PhnB protein